MEKYVASVLKALAIVLIAYFLLMLGNGIGSLLVNTIGPSNVGPSNIFLVGGAFAGLAAGCLTAILFRRAGMYLAPLLSAIPILFSWFGRHARTLEISYVEKNGQWIPIGSPHAQPVYSVLILMLFVAMAAAVIAYLAFRRIANRTPNEA